ncbi:hypothetical protein RB596_005653 [Gaeumannomyces avenae]
MQMFAIFLAALPFLAGVVGAKALRWEARKKNLLPARETFGTPVPASLPPAPTPPPLLLSPLEDQVLDGRGLDNRTYGYVYGKKEWSMVCATDWGWTTFPDRGAVGCCPDSPGTTATCYAYTACLHSSQRSLFTTNNGYTRWCNDPSYPYCQK